MKQVRISERRGSRSRSRSRSRGRTPRNPPSTSRPKRKPKTLSLGNPLGEARMARREIVCTVSGDDKGNAGIYVQLDPLHSSFEGGYLKALCGVFEEIRWNKLVIHWMPALGTTEAGFVCMGFDLTSANPTVDMKHVQALTPNACGPLYMTQTITVDLRRFQFQRWIRVQLTTPEANPGFVCVAGTGPPGKVWGYISLDYAVELAGTRLK